MVRNKRPELKNKDYPAKVDYNGEALAPAAENFETLSDGKLTFTWYNGDTLLEESPKAAGKYTLMVEISETQEYGVNSISFDVEIVKGTPEYTVPADMTATYGDTLADVKLPTGFAWQDETTTSVTTSTTTITTGTTTTIIGPTTPETTSTTTTSATKPTTTTTTTETTTTTTETVPVEKGNVNGDEKIDISDSAMALMIYANAAAGMDISGYTEEQLKAADVDEDGKITISDAAYILTYYAQTAAGMNLSWEDILKK